MQLLDAFEEHDRIFSIKVASPFVDLIHNPCLIRETGDGAGRCVRRKEVEAIYLYDG